MKNYIPQSTKSKAVQNIINEALVILESVGIPMTKTERDLERMTVCFPAVAGVAKNWNKAKGNATWSTSILCNIQRRNCIFRHKQFIQKISN